MVKANNNDEVSLHAYSIQHALTKPASCIPHQPQVSLIEEGVMHLLGAGTGWKDLDAEVRLRVIYWVSSHFVSIFKFLCLTTLTKLALPCTVLSFTCVAWSGLSWLCLGDDRLDHLVVACLGLALA